MKGADDVPALIDAQCGLRHIRKIVGIFNLQLLDIFDRRDQMEFVWNLPKRPDHFWVACVADQDEIVSLRIVAVDLVMHLDDQRTGGIDHMETPPIRFVPHRLGDPMGAENHDRAFRHFSQLLHEYSALGAERVDDMPAMDDFVTNVDGRPILLEREVDDIDRPIDSGAEPSWIGEIDLHNRFLSLS